MVSPSTSAGTTISNTASVTAATTDQNPANNSQTATTTVQSPVLLSPTVVNLERYGVRYQPTSLVVSFSQPLDQSRALNAANYRIVTLGGPGLGGSLKGQVTRIRKVVYNSLAQTVTLYMAKRMDLRNFYRITIKGTAAGGLRGAGGAPLSGAGTTTPGSNFVGVINKKSYAGPAPVATPATPISEVPPTRGNGAVSARALDELVVSGALDRGKRRADSSSLASLESHSSPRARIAAVPLPSSLGPLERAS